MNKKVHEFKKIGRPCKSDDEKVDPKEILVCIICGGTYQRRKKSRHIKTKTCLLHAEINKRIKKFILNDNNYNSVTLGELRSMIMLRKLNRIGNINTDLEHTQS